MTVTIASFRAAFPAFASDTDYPDAMVTLWLTTATAQVNEGRWADLTDLGIMLYTAHELAVERRAAAGASSGAPGSSVGILSSKSADGVSASYDVSTATEKDAGHWNLTTYGTRYYRYLKMMGAGPLQVNGAPSGDGPGAWPGPMRYPF